MIEAYPFLRYLGIGGLVLIGLLVLASLLYGVRGRRFTDRVVAVNVIGTLTISAISILSFVLQESYVLDIALIYALLNFLAVLVLCRVVTLRAKGRLRHLRDKQPAQQQEEGRPQP